MSTFDQDKAKRLLDQAQTWKPGSAKRDPDAPESIEDAITAFRAAIANLPENVQVPYESTPEGERMARFRRVLADSPEFMQRIDRKLLPKPAAFDVVAGWDGSFPGPLAFGATNTAKTRAAWSAIGRLYVKENRPFAWFPARRLVNELAKHEERNEPEEFFRQYDFFKVLFVDDADKINWQFASQTAALFEFYDWVYRKRKPVIATTNNGRDWWANKMGEAFARRMFEGAHRPVDFF